MQIHRSINNLPQFRNSVVTIGTFDGVHLGHQKIISVLKDEAERVDGETIIVTFHPHPRKVINADVHLQMINTLEEKAALLKKQGVDHLVIVPFDRNFSDLSAEQYIEDFLVARFQPHTIIIGYDHHFGKNRKGNFQLLKEKAPHYGYHLLEVPKHVRDEIAVSSTKIRKALLSSDVDTANKLLGYLYFFEGVVVKGDQLGRQLGYPTANLIYTDNDKIHLGEGVYAAYADVDGVEFKGMLSIGKRPTLNDTTEKVEINLFDFQDDLYGKTIKVRVKKFLRHQEKYENLEALTNQIAKDKVESLKVL